MVSVISSDVSVRRLTPPLEYKPSFHFQHLLGKALCQLHAIISCVYLPFWVVPVADEVSPFRINMTVNARTHWSAQSARSAQQWVSAFISLLVGSLMFDLTN